ncbi:hypothetical protein [Pseudopedobacter beijingensis]|uniref:Peptidase family S51 n=1 Tax=Pseudopedobacter beijingensis TaxID=1207056 RepID=A0ABW4IG96_9SPHI
MGAAMFDPITPRGDSGFVTAAVIDPFGNILGLMYNPHYLDMEKKDRLSINMIWKDKMEPLAI